VQDRLFLRRKVAWNKARQKTHLFALQPLAETFGNALILKSAGSDRQILQSEIPFMLF